MKLKTKSFLNFLRILPLSLFLNAHINATNELEEAIKAEIEGETKAKRRKSKGKSKEASYIVSEEEANISFEIFSDMLKQGYRGLCITKRHPEEVKNKYALGNASIIWLTAKGGDGFQTINPMNLQQLHTTIKDFIERGNFEARSREHLYAKDWHSKSPA